MYDETNVPGPEYRVRPVMRYVVTRYCHPYASKDGRDSWTGSSEVIAEVPKQERACEIARAMAESESYAKATVSI